jgi:hypothetical protein
MAILLVRGSDCGSCIVCWLSIWSGMGVDLDWMLEFSDSYCNTRVLGIVPQESGGVRNGRSD